MNMRSRNKFVLCYYKAMIAYEVIVNWVVPKIIHVPHGWDFSLDPPPPPPLWKFQSSFIHLLKFLGLWEPPPPPPRNFQSLLWGESMDIHILYFSSKKHFLVNCFQKIPASPERIFSKIHPRSMDSPRERAKGGQMHHWKGLPQTHRGSHKSQYS